MQKFILVLAGLLSSFPAFSEVEVTNGWVRAMPPGSHMSAAYMSLENKANKTITLLKVSSVAANDCSIHETIIKDGVNRMHQLNGLVLKKDSKVDMQPGGIHIMLMDMNRPLTKEEMFPLKLQFSDGSSKNIELAIGMNK